MSRKIRRKIKCDSKVEETTVLVNQLSELVKALNILVTYIVENNTNDKMQDNQCTGNQIDEENSMTVPVEDIEDDIYKYAPGNAMVDTIEAMGPIIAQIKNPVERKRACDSLRRQLSRARNISTGYKRNLKHRKSNDSRMRQNVQAIGDSIYSKYNANSPRGNRLGY